MSKPTDDLTREHSIKQLTNTDESNTLAKPGEPRIKTDGLIKDTGEGTGFVADWDTIEKNYKKENFGSSHHSSHHSSRHHSSDGHSSSHHSSRHSSGEHGSRHSSGEHSSHSEGHSRSKIGSGGYTSTHRSHRSSSHDSDSDKHSSKHNSRSHHSSRKKDKKERKKWSLRKKIIVGILIFLFSVIIGTVGALLYLRYEGKKSFTNYEQLNLNLPDWVDYRDGGYIIYYKGHQYTFNKNIATFLFMGIDNRKLKKHAKVGSAGQADALYLLTYDVTTSKMRVLCFNRDTMSDISRFDEKGQYLDTKKTQLCLAYAFGDGKKTSAENQRTAVQRLMYNIPISTYYAIDLSAIKILNDDVGGVTVTPQYSFLDFKKGQTITLKGNKAESFVRYRNTNLVDDNLRRIECQKAYIQGFLKRIIPATRKDFGVPSKLYDHSQEYTVTDVDAGRLAYAATDMAFSFNSFDMINTKGRYKMVKGDRSAQFKLKEKPFFETILSLFYTITG